MGQGVNPPHQYYLIAMEVWEDYETYSIIEDWASALGDRR